MSGGIDANAIQCISMPIALQPWIWSSGWRKVMLTHINGYIELWYYIHIYICPYIISFLHRACANLHALHISLLNFEAHSHPRQAVQVAPGAPVPAAQTPGTRAWRHGCNGRCRPSRRSSPSCASAVNCVANRTSHHGVEFWWGELDGIGIYIIHIEFNYDKLI